MWTRTIEVADIRLDIAAQVSVTQDQDMVQKFTTNAPNEAFADGVRFGRFDRRVDHIDAAAFCDALKLRTKLTVVVADTSAPCVC